MYQILPLTNIKKNSRHLKISTRFALLTFLLQALARERAGTFVVVIN